MLFFFLSVALLTCWAQKEITDEKQSFTLTFNYQVKNTEPCQLVEIPEVLRVGIIDGKSLADDGGQNYAAELRFPQF